MMIGRLRQLLMDVGAILTSAASSKHADELERVAGLMRGQDHRSVEDFLDELTADVTPLSPAEIVAGHVTRLLGAGIDETAFRNAFQRLTKDKSITKAAACSIAHEYIGGREKWPTKAAAVNDIEKVFVARRYDASKMKAVANSRPW